MEAIQEKMPLRAKVFITPVTGSRELFKTPRNWEARGPILVRKSHWRKTGQEPCLRYGVRGCECDLERWLQSQRQDVRSTAELRG